MARMLGVSGGWFSDRAIGGEFDTRGDKEKDSNEDNG